MAKRGRPEKLTREKVEVLVAEHDKGRTYLALCNERHIPYASLNAALKRFGLTDKQRKASVVEVSLDAQVA